ncbi:MAG TPA: putative zinc-binding protein [Opitutales bacterium]|nr:putative zinc-binding protein [Opitutales bacterium]
MSNNPKCNCGASPAPTGIIYSCSGAADVGEIADRAARKISRETNVKMSCLAGIGGRVSGLLANASAAPVLVAIDGCPLDCAKKTLELAGFTNVKHVRVTDHDFRKGASPASDGAVDKIAAVAASLL